MTFNISRRGLMGGAAAMAAMGSLPMRARAATVFRYGNAGGPQTVSNTFNAALSEALAEKTDGEISFEIFAGTLGGEKDLIESMALGSLDIYNGAYTGTPEFDILYSPYFFRDAQHAKAVMSTEIGDMASKALSERYDSKLLGVGRLGSYNLMLKDPIESLEDLKGRKIRAPQIKGCIEALDFFGAIPTPIPFNEVYLSLQSGIVDGVLTALNPAVQFKFYEVCKHVVVPDFGLALDKEVISNAAWNSMTPEQQEIMQTTFDELEVTDYYEVGVAQKDKDFAAWAEANGDDALIDLDASGLVEQMGPVNERLANETFDEGAWETINAVEAS
ncbi:TRAP transporter substrate-binding protein [Salipiger mucosus]|uniref:TRAP-type C4-dicarboxylate transport system, periplasmic component n=1 Tax=Salipiger mucosus DSM 16094 TaxID=1123237 RepID=S9QZV8_9RHOB|nr:TRAP transporter substrate-binding protein [Salipiger mucosus]EPX85107.1 TRAP-type C4-dicarboxylate transport system, periplasmic component [Salipiger mucosus DSM 16094]